MPKGSDFGGTGGLGVNFFSKFNQITCVSDSHERHTQQHIFLDPATRGPGEKQKVIKFQ